LFSNAPQLPLLNITYCCFSGGSEY
jgi:hypothetical protein